MTRAIDRDAKRFNEIVRGKIRKDLKRYINHGEMIGRRGRETVSIPVPNIEIPHFRHGKKGSGGTGQGEGDVGQPIGRGQDDGEGTGEAGSEPGAHIREVEVTLEELAKTDDSASWGRVKKPMSETNALGAVQPMIGPLMKL